MFMEQNFKNYYNGALPGDGVPVDGRPAGLPVQQSGDDNRYGWLDRGLKDLFGDEFAIDDLASQRALVEFVRQSMQQNERLMQVMQRDPRLAQMLIDMADGKRNAHSAVARYYGRSLMEVDEGSPEYEEMMAADEERQQEAVRLANDREEYEANLKESRPVIEAFCNEHGYDPAEFMDKVWEAVVFPIMAGCYTREVCTALDHALTYEKDVEDAFAAGDVKGRNTSIQRMKEDFGDGMPKGVASVAPASQPVRRGNSLIEKALNA